ncbi:putative bifunctional diguanylate cyclase/phosphodiesterase [Pseudidiomarina insulisalsae]|uniref:GGDEF domain-containing protein n=1 Tax=Pseudidiomarina insulisalsae TaxID=575789 RepID=A0A432YDH6_9GAMM|nr:bifunctional diguanylate cyclase/phosphodiesterase [Pseudidiomarina insulisalsae]RUO58991.1 GGDEF domain-containing protein [Pseudidiomarina insulisalsae]
MSLAQLLFRKYTPVQRFIVVALLMLAVAAVTLLVWATGGIKYVYSHSMYIPIAIAGTVFGYKGAIVFALVGGLALGPFMPISTETMEMQKTINWMYRCFYFLAVGLLSGLAIDTSRRYIRRLERMTNHDPVTDLPNCKALIERLNFLRTKSRTHQPYKRGFLVICSIDNSMELRSAFGFTVIDSIIEDYAHSLAAMPKYRPELYRIHANQIAGLFHQIEDEQIDDLMSTCLATVKENANFGDLWVYVERHLGGVRLNGNEPDPIKTIQHGEIAIARASERMLDSFIYTPEVGEDISKHLALMADVSDSIDRGDFVMHYQPKINLSNNTIIGAEALIRWHHPTIGWIPPNQFIPFAERSTLILKISEFVLHEVIRQTAAWQQQGIYIKVAINITGHDLLRPGFSQMLFDLLQHYHVDGSFIELEITEGTLIEDMDDLIVKLLKLSKAKITVSIDDFGTGYSSLQYLYKLPVSLLKIDQIFVKNLPDDQGAANICAAAIVLAHKMGIKVLAEGIESKQHLRSLRELGCDYGQGYLICKPKSADDFINWYQDYMSDEQSVG